MSSRAVPGRPGMTTTAETLVARLDGDFTSHTVDADGTAIHCVSGGTGPPVLLVHGFPQDWYEWRHVMPRLARGHTVHAVDLRGVGGSDAPADGYDAVRLGGDLAELVETLGIGPVHVVGHDIGGWAAYALTRLRPDLVSSALILEVLFPGLDVPDSPVPGVPLWHGEFHQVPHLPETLVAGREEAYFRYFLDIGTAVPGVVTDDEIAHYASAYGEPARLHAAFEMYRAIPKNARFFRDGCDPVDVPLLLAGGEQCFGPLMPALARHLTAAHGWSSVTDVVVPGGRHYLPEELPDAVAELIERHAQSVRK
ncbi:alpha/beta hydrolase [Pseudonocardia nematodicida]|uniref:Alpha/beta hydrolase n=1 Tax=Pseudonocardia nematodicida TaxID=1206997 RepID=A0ABV1K8H1_9PSEU